MISYFITNGGTRHAENQRRYRQKDFEFVAIDGEGAGYGQDHKYVLLGCGGEYYENTKGITWQEAFNFLYGCFRKKPKAAYVGFFLGYDFTQILKTLPENRARILLTDRGINARKRTNSGGNHKPFPVRHDGWEFDMLPGRRLQIRPLVCRCYETSLRKCTHEQSEWMYICDSGSFWQCSLLAAINPRNWGSQPVVSQDEFDEIELGKANRSMSLDEYIADRERVIHYMLLENDILCRIMNKLREGFLDIGVNLRKDQWFGPGQAAAAWYKKNGIPKRNILEETVPGYFWNACRESYFGGWFEIFSHGIIPGYSHEYDINSAYPYIIADLPCLLHGRYSEGYGRPPYAKKALCLVHARVSGHDEHIGSMLNRDKNGRIRRPHVTEGWYWEDEIEAAKRAGLISHVNYGKWVSYQPCDCENPVRGFRNLYEHRLRVGKDTALGKASKLVYNSGYGKFAQSVGSAPFGNWVYASRITSGCRRMILNAISTHPNKSKSVLMVATDGIFFDSPHPYLPISKNLGEWDYSKRENLTLFKPGVYWDDKARRAVRDGSFTGFKARGVNARDFCRSIGDIDRQFLRAIEEPPEFRVKLLETDKFTAYTEVEWPWITFEIGFSLTSVKTALLRNDWSLAGQTGVNVFAIQDSDPSDKRQGVYYDESSNRLRSCPVSIPIGEIRSIPYEKGIGIEDPFSLDSRELLGITPDGTADDVARNYVGILSGREL